MSPWVDKDKIRRGTQEEIRRAELKDEHVTTTEWSIRDTETGDVLISMGGDAATQERFEALDKDAPGRYEMVYRTVTKGRWLRAE